MPNYQTNDPKGWNGNPRYGAALGRAKVQDAPQTFAGKLYLRRVRLDSGGYDRNGTYFGIGAPLYWCADEEGDIDFMLRAYGRDDAKERVLEDYPHARFHR